MLAIGQLCANQEVTFVKIDGNDARLAWIREIRQRRLFDRAARGRHEDRLIIAKCFDRQHNRDFLTVDQWEHIDDWLAARGTRPLRHFPNFQPIDTATIRETQKVIMRVRDKQLINPVIFLGGRRLLTASTATLRTVLRQGLALNVATVRKRHDHIGWRDQIFGVKLCRIEFNIRTTYIFSVDRELCLNGL